jgi:hypothetical protein
MGGVEDVADIGSQELVDLSENVNLVGNGANNLNSVPPTKPTGSANNKPGRFVCQSNCKHTTAVDAHKAAAKEYSKLSKKDGIEYGWHVYKHSDGSYTYTFATTGTKTTVAHARLYTSKNGSYEFDSTGHTHVEGDSFSGQDIQYVTRGSTDKKDDRTLYVAAPNGNLYLLTPKVAIANSRKYSTNRLMTTVVHLTIKQVEDKGAF